jgi:hypothetical protein
MSSTRKCVGWIFRIPFPYIYREVTDNTKQLQWALRGACANITTVNQLKFLIY